MQKSRYEMFIQLCDWLYFFFLLIFCVPCPLIVRYQMDLDAPLVHEEIQYKDNKQCKTMAATAQNEQWRHSVIKVSQIISFQVVHLFFFFYIKRNNFWVGFRLWIP